MGLPLIHCEEQSKLKRFDFPDKEGISANVLLQCVKCNKEFTVGLPETIDVVSACQCYERWERNRIIKTENDKKVLEVYLDE